MLVLPEFSRDGDGLPALAQIAGQLIDDLRLTIELLPACAAIQKQTQPQINADSRRFAAKLHIPSA